MQNSDSGKKILTAQEVSDLLRISLSTVHHLTRTGKIKGVKMGKQWRYLQEDIDRCLMNGLNIHKISQDEPAVERRFHPRINCHLQGRVTVPISETENWEVNGRIRNLSEGGLFFESPKKPKTHEKNPRTDDPATITFSLPLASSHPYLKLDGRIVRLVEKSEFCFGLKFKNLTPDIQKVIRDYVG